MSAGAGDEDGVGVAVVGSREGEMALGAVVGGTVSGDTDTLVDGARIGVLITGVVIAGT